MPLPPEKFLDALISSAPVVLRVLERMLGNRELAQDRFQEIVLQAWLKRENFQGDESAVSRWLLGFARYHFLGHVRSEVRRKRLEAMVQNPDQPAEHLPESSGFDDLSSCLKKLPSIKRRIISLFFGLSAQDDSVSQSNARHHTDEEIAELLSLETGRPRSRGSVTMIRLRTLNDLRKCIARRERRTPVEDTAAHAEDSRHAEGYRTERQVLELFADPDALGLDATREHVPGCSACKIMLRALCELEDALSLRAWDQAVEVTLQQKLEAPAEDLVRSLRTMAGTAYPRLELVAESPKDTERVVDTGHRAGRTARPWSRALVALAASVLVMVGVRQVIRTLVSPSDATGPETLEITPTGAGQVVSTPGRSEVRWRGTPDEPLNPGCPLQAAVQPREVISYTGDRGNPGEMPPRVLSAKALEPGRWLLEIPPRSLALLFVPRPRRVLTWSAEVRCVRTGGEPLPLVPDGETIWQGNGDSTDPELPVGSPLDLEGHGLAVGAPIRCTVRRDAEVDRVEIRLARDDVTPSPAIEMNR